MSLAAAKKRRAPGQPIQPPPPMQTVSRPQQQQQQRPQNIQQAVSLTMTRVSELEKLLNENLKEIEGKFGQQDTYIVENIPDIDAINNALEDINQRLLNLETRGGGDESSVNASSPDDNTAQKLFNELSTQINMHEELFNSNDQRLTNLEEIKNTVNSFSDVISNIETNKSDAEMRITTLNSSFDNLQQNTDNRLEELEAKYAKLLSSFEQMQMGAADNKVDLKIDEIPSEEQSES